LSARACLYPLHGRPFGWSTLKLSGYEGTSFDNFEQIPDKKAFKEKYRQALNALPIDDTTVENIVAEANNGFRFNMQMANDLVPLRVRLKSLMLIM